MAEDLKSDGTGAPENEAKPFVASAPAAAPAIQPVAQAPAAPAKIASSADVAVVDEKTAAKPTTIRMMQMGKGYRFTGQPSDVKEAVDLLGTLSIEPKLAEDALDLPSGAKSFDIMVPAEGLAISGKASDLMTWSGVARKLQMGVIPVSGKVTGIGQATKVEVSE